MVISYFLFCFPVSYVENSALNSVYFGFLMFIFFGAYTLSMVTYYGTYAEVTENESDRYYLSSWKAFVDTVQYAGAYALIPLFVGMGINIQSIALLCGPFALTMIIALLMLKERSTLPADMAKYVEETGDAAAEKEVPLMESLRMTTQNKDFMAWLAMLGAFFFGLQMFLSGQNVLASGPMGLNGWQIAVINSAAFAPVPLTLIIYRKIMRKKGFRIAFQGALVMFALSMLTFSVAYVNWIPSQFVRLMIGITAATFGSYAIGAFLAAPYLVPAQLAAAEAEATGVSHPSMYFAVQGLVTAVVGAVSTGLVWPNLRNITPGGNQVFGAHLMPYIAALGCVVAFFIAKKLPKMFDSFGKDQ